MEKLHDIKPIEIESFAIYGYLLFFLVVVILLSILFIYIYKKSKIKKTTLVSKEFFDLNSKKLCYEFTLFVKTNKNPKYEKELNQLLQKLEKYKYHKEEIAIESSLVQEMKEYIEKLEHDQSTK